MDGIVVVNKPYGATSHQVVQSVRRTVPPVKAGHSGTLDPIATGVLPVCLGRATRIVEYIIDHPKTYRAAVTLGKTTDTEDSAGRITGFSQVPGLDREQVEEILAGFKGKIEQLPPLYSAVKYRGKPLYRWTRSGKEVPRKPRLAEIYRIELLEYNHDREPQLVFDVVCSKGTYIRTLAVDLGKAIGCGGHLSSLVRLAVGPFVLENAFSMDQIAELSNRGRLDEIVEPMDTALRLMPALYLEEELINALKNGQSIYLEDRESLDPPKINNGLSYKVKERTDLEGAKARIYDRANNFKAIGRLEKSGEGFRVKTLKYLAP